MCYLLLLGVLLLRVEAIIERCEGDGICPSNSTCVNDYCRCLQPYILDCDVKAYPLSSNFKTYTITDQLTYFSIEPTQLNTDYLYTFNICPITHQFDNYSLGIGLWANVGQDQLTRRQELGSGSRNLSAIPKNQCLILQTSTLYFGEQPNEEKQGLILVITLQPKNSQAMVKISMNVEEAEVYEDNFLFSLAIAVVSIIILLAVISIVWCVYRKCKRSRERRRKEKETQKLLQNFKEQMPQIYARELNLTETPTCSICLGDFEGKQKVRNLICGHAFHSPCIDSWCVKNLNCPVCRMELDDESIQMKKNSKTQQKNGEKLVELGHMSERNYSSRSRRDLRESILETQNRYY